MNQLRLGIEASNLQESGGLIHMVELLRAAEPSSHGICQVIVWGMERSLKSLPKKEWLTLRSDPLLNQSLAARMYWQRFKLTKAAELNCDILFVPGGSYAGRFRPYIAMNQNVLPFEQGEYRRYGLSWMFFKMKLLQFSQTTSFREANGTLFLTEYARTIVMEQVNKLKGEYTIIPHGVQQGFRLLPRPARSMASYTQTSPFRLLYVSNVLPYKHQWNVVRAVHELRQAGFWVELDLLGSAYPPSLRRLQEAIQQIDPEGKFIHYHGEIPHSELSSWYHQADGFVFASSCESFSITLLEAMAAGLPIACSNRGPLPGLLGDAGIYFDPEQQESIVEALAHMLKDNTWRDKHAQIAYSRALDFSWERCARETFGFIAKIANHYKGNLIS